jgi:high-affinity Fe2+/Pb2+ permease
MTDKQPRRVTSYVRKDGTRVKSHTRSAGWARSRAAWVGAGFSTLTAAALLWELGATVLATVAIVITAGLTTVAVIAGKQAEKNRKTMHRQQQRRRRTSTTRRRTSSSARRRTSSTRRR